MQNIVLGIGSMLLNKDELYLFKILKITALKAIWFLRSQESRVLNWLVWVKKICLELVSKVHSMEIIAGEIRSKIILFEKIWPPLKWKIIIY